MEGSMTMARLETWSDSSAALTRETAGLAVHRLALWGIAAASLVAGWGVQWDILWHLRIGRDSFWIAPHVMTYAGLTGIVLLSFGVLAVDTWRRRGARGAGDEITVMGITSTPGFHLAAWGIALTVVAAPIDDLWHRLFGIDVTLWSPPHLLGLIGAQINSLACLLIAREVWPSEGRARTLALATGAMLLFSGFQTGIDPALRTAFIHGGIRYFTYALLGALFLTFTLVLASRLTESRTVPIVVAVASVVLQLVVIFVGD